MQNFNQDYSFTTISQLFAEAKKTTEAIEEITFRNFEFLISAFVRVGSFRRIPEIPEVQNLRDRQNNICDVKELNSKVFHPLLFLVGSFPMVTQL